MTGGDQVVRLAVPRTEYRRRPFLWAGLAQTPSQRFLPSRRSQFPPGRPERQNAEEASRFFAREADSLPAGGPDTRGETFANR